jgi:hypothetical protein
MKNGTPSETIMNTISIVRKGLLGVAAVVTGIAIGSCGITQSVTLQHVDVTGSVATAPIYVTENAQANQFIISPHFSIRNVQNVTGGIALDATQNYPPSAPDSDNLLWRIPRSTGGLNVNYIMSQHTAFAFEMNLSSLGGRTYGGWSAGLGLFNEKENQAIRFDIGLRSTPILYSAETRVITKNGSRTDTSMYFDWGEESHMNVYAGLTFNTTRKSWPVNLFLQGYVTKQQFIDYVPYGGITHVDFTGDTRASASQWIVGLTPGIFLDLMEDVRLVAGEQIIFPFDIVNQSPYPLLQFHMQLDITM